MKFQKATKKKARLRMAIVGPAGSGKTYTALAIATAMGGKTAVIDTEHGSASKYANLFPFDTLELTTFAPATYVQAIQAAEAEGYDNIVVDSLSHAWMGKGGALEMVDKAARTSKGGNSFSAWGDVTPEQNKMIEAMLACRANLFATMRSKQDYVQEKDDRTGKTIIRKVGMAPVQRDGVEYEFDVIGDLTIANDMTITKTRCPALAGQVFSKPGADVAELLRAWLSDGEDVAAPKLTDDLPSALRLTDDEVATLQEWIDSTATDVVAFLRHFKAASLDTLKPEQFADAIEVLKRKAARGVAA